MAGNGRFEFKTVERGDECRCSGISEACLLDKCAAAYIVFDLLQVKQSREDTQWSAWMWVCLTAMTESNHCDIV